MLEELIKYKEELQCLLDSGKDLREISQWSFAQRESGRNVPYLAISQTIKTDKRKTIVVGLFATPTIKQKELKVFFDELVPGMRVLTRWSLTINTDESPVIKLKERLGKGSFKLY